MKKFLLKVFIFLISFSILMGVPAGFLFFVAGPQYGNNYMAAVQDKIAYMRSIQSPRIILTGNSNLAFGIDSEQMEEELGMPVVNLGMHGGMGNQFHYNMAKKGVREGDIVVVCNSSFREQNMDHDLAWICIENHKELWDLIPKKDCMGMIKSFPRYLVKALGVYFHLIKIPCEKPYSRDSFNLHGDIDWPREKSTFRFTPALGKMPRITDEGIRNLNEFAEYCSSQGAICVVAGCPNGKGKYTPEIRDIDEFESNLRQKLNCEVISSFKDYLFEYDLFYDTQYHLTNEGVRLRTDMLIKDLREWNDRACWNEILS